MSGQIIPFNPLAKENLGKSVAEALLNSEPRPLEGLTSFNGAGIYAIYYHGPFPAYQEIAARNRGDNPAIPIYIGKAVPAGGRKGVAVSVTSDTRALFLRLKEHAESVAAAASLDIKDFRCRYLVVDDIWIPLGEALLISKFSPVWNMLVDGFGNHDPGSGRYAGLRPRWDVLHPGRAWALKCKERAADETAATIGLGVETYLRSVNLPANPHILKP